MGGTLKAERVFLKGDWGVTENASGFSTSLESIIFYNISSRHFLFYI